MNLLSSTDLNSFTSAIQDHFDTFSINHSLTVIKKPQQQISNINTNSYYGYGQDNVNPDNVTYIPVSGTFKCMVISKDNRYKDNALYFLPQWIINSTKIIKTNLQTQQFLENGQENERLILDNEIFIKVSSSYKKTYGDLDFYYFGLNQTS